MVANARHLFAGIPHATKTKRTMRKAILLILAMFTAVPSMGQTVFDGKWRKRVETEENVITGRVTAIANADIKAQEFFAHSSDAPGINFSMSYACRSETEEDPFYESFMVYTGELLANSFRQEVNVKWGDTPGKEFIKEPGTTDRSFFFLDTDAIMEKVLTHDNLLIEVPLYRYSSIYLDIELANAEESITKAKGVCND